MDESMLGKADTGCPLAKQFLTDDTEPHVPTKGCECGGMMLPWQGHHSGESLVFRCIRKGCGKKSN